jgi:riboflavin synthase
MFSGIVETTAEVLAVLLEPPGKRLVVVAPAVAADAILGESIAVNGCCLTVVVANGDRLEFQAGPETLLRTNLGDLQRGNSVNLERSLRLGDRLGGHWVTGHIDGVGIVENRVDEGSWTTIWFRTPRELTRQMAAKGSVAVDGVSLTLVAVEGERFCVQLIPHTLSFTTLSDRRVGDRVNIETDVLAKYVERQLETSVAGPKSQVPD